MSNQHDAYSLTIGGEVRSFLWITTFIHIAAWIAQFYGHGVHEGRAPALTENLGFALLAPFFVTFEFLHYGFGYKEGPEMKDVRTAIAKDIKQFRQKKSK